MAPPHVKWRSDFDKFVITANFDRRGWQKWNPNEDGGEDWNFFWANVHTVKQIFLPDNGIRLEPWQIINHFPNHYELTRKDLMVKNIKRYQKSMKREGVDSSALDIVPVTYMLPQDYSLFVEEYKKQPNTTWIMKPTSRSQGKGIFLFTKLSQVKKWAAGIPSATKTAENYVVSRYIDNPMLVGGKKFDLRLYVVVCSYRPLKAYISDLGFARFCNEKYSNEIQEIDNMYIHLTNVAIQKHGETYNDRHGNKWPLQNLRMYIAGTRGTQACRQLFSDIDSVIITSLKACQTVMINDRHCFELYGFDVIVDENLKPWLIEVNASPSLTASTRADRLLKTKVLHDTFTIVCPPQWTRSGFNPSGRKDQNNADDFDGYTPKQVGSFRLLYDETGDIEAQRNKRDDAIARASTSRARGRTLGSIGT